jgi:branched-chain amino acid transport system substrate-binding protein
MIRSLTRFAILALALVAASSPMARAADPYEIHVITELTGPVAFLGARQLEVLRVLEGYVNGSGGIRGRPLKFVFHDDTTNPQVAVQLANDLIGRKVPVFLGPGLAAVSQAVFPLVEKNGPVLWCFSPIVKVTPGSYTFMSAPSLEDVQPVMLRYFYGHGVRNVAEITSTDSTGQNFEDKFDVTLNRLEFRNVKLVAREHFNTTDLSVAAQMARIKAAKPDLLVTFVTGAAFGTVLHAVADSGLDIPVYGSGGNFSIDLMEQFRTFLPKDLYLNAAQGVVQDPNALPAVKRRQADYFAAMKKAGYHVEFLHTLTWDPALAIVDAVRKLGPDVTAAQLHEYLEHLKGWVGVQGVYDFTSGDQKGLHENGAALFRWNRNRKDFDLIATGPKFD